MKNGLKYLFALAHSLVSWTKSDKNPHLMCEVLLNKINVLSYSAIFAPSIICPGMSSALLCLVLIFKYTLDCS